jgi:hypothetical protein
MTHAFSPDTYTSTSVLSSGSWVKISVPSTGLYTITASSLRSWGFSDPSKVRIYGYGGNQLSDVLSLSNYIDDLPLIQSINSSSGVTFYAVGPESWAKQSSGMWIHSLNQFSTVGYYFVTENSDVPLRDIEVVGSAPSTSSDVATTFTEVLYHEIDNTSPGQAGHLLVGEDFRYSASQTFNFTLTDRVEQSAVSMECSFLTKTYTASSTLSFTANGTALPRTSQDIIGTTNSSSYYHGTLGVTRKSFTLDSNKLALGITYSTSGVTNAANLDYIVINYTRSINLYNGKLLFHTPSSGVRLNNATANTVVWDVTNPLNIVSMPLSIEQSQASWISDYSGERNYAAWDQGATALPSPTYIGRVSNQNLHALETPNMVIFTTPDFSNQASRIAELHRNDATHPLTVEIIEQNAVFNEFSSGSADVNAFRRMLKMLYDRGDASNKLQYALFIGRGFHDNRRLTTTGKALGANIMPVWETATGVDDNKSYTTDDIFGFLDDNSGLNMSTDQLSIAVGRIPASSVQEAKDVVDKLYAYAYSMPKTAWKNQVLILADDQDNGTHMNQAETLYKNIESNSNGSEFMFTKVYIDAFEQRNGGYPEARELLYNKLDEGVMWWTFIGHANMTSMTGEQMITFNDMNSLYLRRYPILYAATCDLLRWDNSAQSGAEVMHFLQNGGTIATISATRPVYISENGLLSAAIGTTLPTRDESGYFYTIGEIYRRSKNLLSNNDNKLRYVLMGDPAMHIAMPSASAVLESINGQALDDDAQITVAAHSEATLTGSLYDIDGSKMTDFNGEIAVVLYDAEKSTISNGYGEGSPVAFDEQGSLLYSGKSSVINGEFSIKVAMPMDIDGNFRPAALSMYAYSTAADDTREASGCNRDFYVYGYDEDAADDTTPPIISQFVLNHSSFASGESVNESPMVIATVSDDRGINLSSSGVGHQMTLTLDGTTTYSNVAQYYTPNVDQDNVSGSIAYPIDELTAGNHTLRLRVWDTSGNLSESEIDFYVVTGLAPKIYDIYTDANPATTEANFYISHNRPDATLTVTVSVYNLLGSKIWENTVIGRSDMFTSSPVTWNLTDLAGHTVNRGIYLYRATISTDGTQTDTGTRKLAVAPL